MIDYFLALALLFGDAEPPTHPSPEVREAFNQLANQWEVGSIPDGYGYEPWFPYQVYLARCHLDDLRDAPLIADAARLPPFDIADGWVRSSEWARGILKARASMDGAVRERIELALYDDLPRHNALASLAKATHPNESVPDRRAAMKELLRHIGAKRYAGAQWPEPIPFHLLPNAP